MGTFTNDWQKQRNANIIAEYNKLSAKQKEEALEFAKQNKKHK